MLIIFIIILGEVNYFLDSYKEVKVVLKYGRKSISKVEFISAIKTKEFELMALKHDTPNVEVHFAKWVQN